MIKLSFIVPVYGAWCMVESGKSKVESVWALVIGDS